MKKRKSNDDGFDRFRDELGADTVDTFLATLGLGPKYTPPPGRECPECHRTNAYIHEIHPDTGMDEMILRCPDCRKDFEP